jgi:hypothetical protein
MAMSVSIMTFWIGPVARVASAVFVGTTVCVGSGTGVEVTGTFAPKQDTVDSNNTETSIKLLNQIEFL